MLKVLPSLPLPCLSDWTQRSHPALLLKQLWPCLDSGPKKDLSLAAKDPICPNRWLNLYREEMLHYFCHYTVQNLGSKSCFITTSKNLNMNHNMRCNIKYYFGESKKPLESKLVLFLLTNYTLVRLSIMKGF